MEDSTYGAGAHINHINHIRVRLLYQGLRY